LGVTWQDLPVLAALALITAMGLAAHRAPDAEPELRGPGQWQTLDAATFEPVPCAPLPGAWLDAGRPQGFALMLSALAAATYVAARWFESSPHYGTCVLLGSSALLPIFCTGREAELPLDALERSRRFLGKVQRRLSASGELVVKPMGRFAAGDGALDELRLSIAPPRGLPGLMALELGLEFRQRLGGFSAGAWKSEPPWCAPSCRPWH
jgi:hypothetical protein